MSRNLGRQSHRAQQSAVHAQLHNEITDVKSRINSSAQETKDLKGKLKGLSDKKKEMGQSPRHSQAPSNRHNVPIPQIRPPSLPSNLNESASLSESSINRNIASDLSMSETPPALANSPYDNIPQIQSLVNAPSTENTQSHEAFDMNTSILDSPLYMNRALEFPPFDLDMFNAALEAFDMNIDSPNSAFEPPFDFAALGDGPIPQPTAEELQAHQFLWAMLGK